jgi:membrane-associated phospholipid phosphatase
VALRERMLAAAPSGREWTALGVLAGVLVVLTTLVALGTLTRVDRYAVDHLMPWLDLNQHRRSPLAGYWRPFPLGVSTGAKLLDLLTYPCSLLISTLCIGGAALHMWRRGLRVAALAPVAAWVIGNGVEFVGKHTITRPALYGTRGGVRIHISSFDDSFPSGHMIRGILVAYALVLAWNLRLRWIVALWVVVVAPTLVLQAAHTPTDVVGGALIGVMLVLLMRAAVRPELAGEQP